MMKCYVLTEQNMRGCGAADRHFMLGNWMARDIGTEGESEDFLVYDHPLLAALFSRHDKLVYQPARLFESLFDGRAGHRDDCGMTRLVHRLKLVKEIPLPALTDNHRRRFAIYCAREALASCDDQPWFKWADGWTSGVGRGPYADTFGCTAAETLHRAAQAADDAASAVYCLNGEHPPRVIDYTFRAATSAIRALCAIRPQTSEKWVSLAKHAIADEDKLQEEQE